MIIATQTPSSAQAGAELCLSSNISWLTKHHQAIPLLNPPSHGVSEPSTYGAGAGGTMRVGAP